MAKEINEKDRSSISYENQHIVNVDIEKEMKKSYIDYSMSVIVGRALPDVRDGLKPVHRRILYTMYEDSLYPDRPYRKSATTVGDVLGRYHPHGDASVYDALVRMAQDFSLRYPMVDGQGNFGSVDGDPPAAYRYTEARMTKLSLEMLTDIDKDTIDFTLNYDEKRKEPTVLPSRFPSLLVNGSSGIAVGMATSIPPHNLSEVVDAIFEILDNPECTLADLMEHIKGPDFPTGGTIMGYSGIRAAYATGRGKLIVRAKAEIVEGKNDRFRIIVTELPYMVNKARLIENIADLVKDKRIEGIADLRDESDRDGMSIVIELKRDANAQVVLNQLYRYTQMQETFSAIMLALVDNQPKILTLREMLDNYIFFQKEVITRRVRFDLKKAQDRAHILEGLKIAIDNIDEVINIIRASKSIDEAKTSLMARFGFTDIQAQAIVDMRLGKLTGLERDKIEDELAGLLLKIKDLQDILANETRIIAIFKEELGAIRDKFKDERRTDISMVMNEIDIEDLIEEETCVYTLTHYGYVKRQAADVYKTQHRGGRGISAMTTREEDFVEELFVGSTHDYILFFTNKGRVYRLKGYEIPETGRNAKGTNIVNLLPITSEEKISAVIPVKIFDESSYLLFSTKNGTVKKTPLIQYNTARKGGLNAIVLDEDDELIRVALTDGESNIILGTHNGYAIRFNEQDVRSMGRMSRGVRGIRLRQGDYVVGMCVEIPGGTLLSVTENGSGKRTDIEEYRIQTRGGMGITNYKINDKTGKVAGILMVDGSEDIMMISSDGIIIRMTVESISCIGRSTSGVKLMRLADGISVVTVAKTEHEEDAQIEAPEQTANDLSPEELAQAPDEEIEEIIEEETTEE
ncbi:MAG: DNA gyrase subunit A [Ruminococcaceae bacterium]|nr:DNA gyrase subunit A [Oscillospiraceae bacterium]